MRQSKALLLATSLATSLAWEFPQTSSDGTYGLGPPPLWGNSKSAMSVQENINKTYGRLGAFQTTVPVHIGNDDWKFHVNTGQIQPYGVDTDVNNPLFVYTGYSVQTPSGSDLNSSIQSSEQLKGNQANGLCTRVPLGLFSSSVTNGYKQSDNGDCSNALGSDCTEALKNMGYGIPSGSDICSPSFVIPDECKSVFPDGGFGSAPLVQTDKLQNEDDRYAFAFWHSPLFSATSSKYFLQERNRLHVVIFTGAGNGKSTYPVCARLVNEKVASDSSATSDAMSSFSGRNTILGFGSALLVAMFLS